MRVAVCHPDLGLGGAERLVVDQALELADRGCAVDVFTAHHDPARCFEETIAPDKRFTVQVKGGWFPRTILGRCVALCAYVRCAIIALHIAMRASSYDVVLMDQVSAAILPIKAIAPGLKVVFYCHFPDLLLSTAREGWLKRAYRLPLDWLEETTTGLADAILVNSEFTRGIFFDTFKRLKRKGTKVSILYPAVAIDGKAKDFHPGTNSFLSINRFEWKKNIALAVQALSGLHERMKQGGDLDELPKLMIAGGYDERLSENRECLAHLKGLVLELGLEGSVSFFPSFSNEERERLLESALAVLYTPEREHFGIVPLEAMAAARPVLACNSGGPLETVLHGKTGVICEPTPESFAAAMAKCVDREFAERIGKEARKHVVESFSRKAFGDKLFRIVKSV